MTGTADDRTPVHPSLSEAGRLLCAGNYLDAAYRDRVIQELYVHEERYVAPSYGFDAARVLAHALQARRAEAAWASAVLAVWGLGLLLAQPLLLFLLLPAAFLSGAGRIVRRRERTGRGSRFLELLLRGCGYVLLIGVGVGVLQGALEGATNVGGADDSLRLYEHILRGIEQEPFALVFALPRLGYAIAMAYAWTALIVFALLTLVVGLQRGHFARVISTSLSRTRYADPNADPASGSRFARTRDRILRTQHSRLVIYDVDDPFCGAGAAYRPWHLSVELRPRTEGWSPNRWTTRGSWPGSGRGWRPCASRRRTAHRRPSRPYWTGCGSWSSTSACSSRPPGCPRRTSRTSRTGRSTPTGPEPWRRAGSAAATSCGYGSVAGTRTSSSPSSYASTPRAGC